MRTLLHIELDDESKLGGIETNVRSEDDLLALSQALYTVLSQNPIIRAGLSAFTDLVRESGDARKFLKDSVMPMPDFNEILKEKK